MKRTDLKYLAECLDYNAVPENFRKEIETAIAEIVYLRGLNTAFTQAAIDEIETIICPAHE